MGSPGRGGEIRARCYPREVIPGRRPFKAPAESLPERILRKARRIAVLGIKPEERRDRDAFSIPLYLSKVGYEIIPVPVYYPDCREILGRPVVRRIAEIAPPPDIVNVFRRPEHFAAHLADVLALRPAVVWFQSGLLHSPSAAALEEAGITVIEECIGCRRASMFPSIAPLAELPSDD